MNEKGRILCMHEQSMKPMIQSIVESQWNATTTCWYLYDRPLVWLPYQRKHLVTTCININHISIQSQLNLFKHDLWLFQNVLYSNMHRETQFIIEIPRLYTIIWLVYSGIYIREISSYNNYEFHALKWPIYFSIGYKLDI